ncbi:MAG: hypothetical protein QM697_14505 [Lachnospiraceae bacterium]
MLEENKNNPYQDHMYMYEGMKQRVDVPQPKLVVEEDQYPIPKENTKDPLTVKGVVVKILDLIRWVFLVIWEFVFIFGGLSSKEGGLIILGALVSGYIICPLNRRIDPKIKIPMWGKALIIIAGIIIIFVGVANSPVEG